MNCVAILKESPLHIEMLPNVRCRKLRFHMRKLLDVRTESPGNNLVLPEKDSTNTVNTIEVEEDTEFSSDQNAGDTNFPDSAEKSRTAENAQDNEDHQHRQQVQTPN